MRTCIVVLGLIAARQFPPSPAAAQWGDLKGKTKAAEVVLDNKNCHYDIKPGGNDLGTIKLPPTLFK